MSVAKMNITGVQKYLNYSKPERFFAGIMVQHAFNYLVVTGSI